MYIETENGIITMMRGDTIKFPLKINIGTKLCPEYRPITPYETLYFALMEPGQAFENAILKKRYTSLSPKDNDGNVLLILESSDTEFLLTGKYYYTVKLKTVEPSGSETVNTIILPTLFYIEGNNPIDDSVSEYKDIARDIDEVILDGGELR